MDFARFAEIPVIDGHIHFPHARLAGNVLAVMETVGLIRVNLVSIPDLQSINHNPALIYCKAHHPERFTICGALDYTQVFADPTHATETLAAQVATLRRSGFDGLKLVEGKPIVRKMLSFAFDGREYAGMWAALEEQGIPIVFHVADPEEFWDAALCPDWARARGWFYGDGAYPAKEGLYAEVERVLIRHPGLKVIFAHFFFLSADLARAGAFLDAHPAVYFDLTPGVEMYLNFARDLDATRAFFLRYQDRLIYGTDIGATAIELDPALGLDMAESLGRAWIVRQFLESGEAYRAPEEVGHSLGMDVAGLHGIALPREVLHKIYRANFERIFGSSPIPLDHSAALAELERMAAELDAQAGVPVESAARRVARELATSLGG